MSHEDMRLKDGRMLTNVILGRVGGGQGALLVTN